MPYIKRLTLLTTIAAIIHFANSKTAERERAKVDTLEFAPTLLYTLVFIIRRIWKRCIQLLLGTTSNNKAGVEHDVPSSWGFLDGLILRVLHFHARVGDIHVPQITLDFYSKLNRLIAKPIHGIYVTDIPSSFLGFGPFSRGEQRFGQDVSNIVEGAWITLEGESFAQGRDRDMLTIVYYHGGGFVIGNNAMYLPAFSKWLQLLRHKGIRAGILSIEYPLAPRFKHPIPIETGWFVYDFLTRETGLLSPERTIIGGDSAGGIMALIYASRASKFGVAGCVAISPWVGHKHDTDSHRDFAEIDFIGGKELLAQYQAAAFHGGQDVAIKDDLLHVVDGSPHFDKLPPTFITAGESEVFFDDICEFARNNLKSSEHQLFTAKSMPHIWPMLYPLFQEETHRALDACATFCVETTHAAKEQTKSLQKGVGLFVT
jgi:monoterpene epsilon-lactone hydrolase